VPFDFIQPVVSESCKKESDGWAECMANFVTFPVDVRFWLGFCRLVNMQSRVTNVLPRVSPSRSSDPMAQFTAAANLCT
jgi:hypothetical protein